MSMLYVFKLLLYNLLTSIPTQNVDKVITCTGSCSSCSVMYCCFPSPPPASTLPVRCPYSVTAHLAELVHAAGPGDALQAPHPLHPPPPRSLLPLSP